MPGGANGFPAEETDYDDCSMWPGWLIPVYGDNYGRSYCEELDHFSVLDDPRRSGKVVYPLPEITLPALGAAWTLQPKY